jgi:hypothetical protein
MAYPAYIQTDESGVDPIDNLQVDRATNGLRRGRATFTAPKKRFTVKHKGLTAAQADTLDAFYNSNRTASFDFVWSRDGLTYTCGFAEGGAPRWSCWQGSWSAVVVLET